MCSDADVTRVGLNYGGYDSNIYCIYPTISECMSVYVVVQFQRESLEEFR